MEGNYIKRVRLSKCIQVVRSGMYRVYVKLPFVALLNLKSFQFIVCILQKKLVIFETKLIF